MPLALVSSKSPEVTQVEFFEASNKFNVNNKHFEMDSECMNLNGRLYIVTKYLVDALLGSTSWDNKTKAIFIDCQSHRIRLTLNKNTAKVDGKNTVIDSKNSNIAPIIYKNRTLVPMRFIAENLGGEVLWDATLKKATLTFKRFRLTNIIFLHHSCGENLINQGNVRTLFKNYKNLYLTDKLTIQFYDHGYNDGGLTDQNGNRTGRNYNVPDDNTNPDGFATIFLQNITNPPKNCFSQLMAHEVIVFKSCFPVSDIGSEDQLNEYKQNYLTVRKACDKYPQKVFIIITQPPLTKDSTSQEVAARARRWTQWLQSDDFLDGHRNLFTFDWFDLLAESNSKSGCYNCLKQRYTGDPYDSHPNEIANRETAPAFIDFIIKHAVTY